MAGKNKIRNFVESRTVTWLGIVFVGVLLSTGKMANIIGNYFPVVTPLKITSIQPMTAQNLPSSLISGVSEKLLDCDERTMEWFTTNGKNEGAVFSLFLDKPQSRNTGEMIFKGIVVGLPPEKIMYARAEVTHDCFNGYVRVVSSFFEGTKVE